MYITWSKTNDISSCVLLEIWDLPHEKVFTELLYMMYNGSENVLENVLTPYYILSTILRCKLFESIITEKGKYKFLLYPVSPSGIKFESKEWLRALDKTCLGLYKTSQGLQSLSFHRPSIQFSVNQKSTKESIHTLPHYRKIGLWNQTTSMGYVITIDEHDSYQFRHALSQLAGSWTILSIGTCNAQYPAVTCDSLLHTRSQCLPNAEYTYLLGCEIDKFLQLCCTIDTQDESQTSHMEDVTVSFLSWWKRVYSQELDDTICAELFAIIEQNYPELSCNGVYIHGLCVNEDCTDSDSEDAIDSP